MERFYHHHVSSGEQNGQQRDNVDEGEPCRRRMCPKHWCYTGLATLAWLALLIQLFVVVLTLIRQNVTCGWNPHGGTLSATDNKTTSAEFCFPWQHPVMEGLVLALYLGILWLATFLTYMLVAWVGQFCCQSSRQPVDEEQQYPPIYYAHNNTITSLSYWSTRHQHHRFSGNDNNNNNNNRRRHYYYYSYADEQSPPTVASSSWGDSDEDSDESTPLIVYVV